MHWAEKLHGRLLRAVACGQAHRQLSGCGESPSATVHLVRGKQPVKVSSAVFAHGLLDLGHRLDVGADPHDEPAISFAMPGGTGEFIHGEHPRCDNPDVASL